MRRIRGAPFHLENPGKIEHCYQALKNRILLENYFWLGYLKAQVEAFVEQSNH